ncbi:MAG: UvrB/UvrC motif-containing protein [Oscillospiraceae bacterium]|nr:UvrB/UvrC motif-containing protein [Oscillospiraceae bacterium]
MTRREIMENIDRMQKEMRHAAQLLEFEYAAKLRDAINELKKQL